MADLLKCWSCPLVLQKTVLQSPTMKPCSLPGHHCSCQLCTLNTLLVFSPKLIYGHIFSLALMLSMFLPAFVSVLIGLSLAMVTRTSYGFLDCISLQGIWHYSSFLSALEIFSHCTLGFNLSYSLPHLTSGHMHPMINRCTPFFSPHHCS